MDNPTKNRKSMVQEINFINNCPVDLEETFPIKKRENLSTRELKRLIEALLFASSEPLSIAKIRDVTDSFHPLKPSAIESIIEELQSDYIESKRGFRLEEVGGGFLLRSCEEFKPYLQLLYREKRGEKLSQSAAEVLAIIAYRQPITRPQIEAIRGVDSSYIVGSLLERGLVTEAGKLEAPGRPTLYAITQEFLSHFGLKNVKDLPEIKKEA